MKVYTFEAFQLKEKICLVADNISKWEDRQMYNVDFTFKKFEEVRKAKKRVRKFKKRFYNLYNKEWNNIKKYVEELEKLDREKCKEELIKYIDKLKMEKHDELKRRYSKARRYVKYLEKKIFLK